MLVVSRKRNERVVVGGVVRITIVEIRRGEVRIEIEAPAGIPIVCDSPPTPPDRTNDESPNGA
jgi:carbon storage regulator CsrA